MDRRKAATVVVLVVLLSTASLVLFSDYIFGPTGPQNPDGSEDQIVYSPYNDLNWWDIAALEGKLGDVTLTIKALADINGRWTMSDGYFEAADYVFQFFDDLDVSVSYWGDHDSVVAYKRGYGNDNRAIVFGAHLDGNRNSPGVDQNAGGVGVVLAIARMLDNYQFPVDIYYCLFDGNLPVVDPQMPIRWLYGSNEVADILVANGVDVMAFFNFDELLFINPPQPEIERLIVEYKPNLAYHQSKYLSDLLQSSMFQLGYHIMSVKAEGNTDTDHQSFWKRGFPAVNVRSGHELDQDQTVTDSLSSSDFNMTQAYMVAQAAASTAVFLAMQGNGQVTSQKIIATLPPGNFTQRYIVNTIPQKLYLTGVVSNTTLDVTISNSTHILSKITPSSTNVSLFTAMNVPVGPIHITITNTGTEDVHLDLRLEYDQDTDGNGVTDSEQYSWPPPDPPLDWDGDGLPDANETAVGTDIFQADTDQDSISDFVEVVNHLNPLVDDTSEDNDNDGLSNLLEIRYGTQPFNNDTDSDGITDGFEVQFGLDPLVNDSMDDPDNDTLTNLYEFQHGSDPFSVDGDQDGLTDVEEIALGLNPLDADSDGDSVNDFIEVENGLNPLAADSDSDLIPDGADPNPKVNQLLIFMLIGAVPIVIGSTILWRRIR